MKLVKEYLYEKFTEESDPITDMNIGGYSFKNLKPGAVLKAKTNVSIKRDNSGYLTNWGKGINVAKGDRIIVTSSRLYILKGYKEIKIFIPVIQDDVEINRARENLKINPHYTGPNIISRLIITESQFNNKFEVVEKGYDN